MLIDGKKINANASKYRSIRYDRARERREKRASDITALMERAEAADVTETKCQVLPDELARREALKARLDETCARHEMEAREQAVWHPGGGRELYIRRWGQIH